MGGETTEMSATTTRVLVEAAHWDAVSMFRTGKRHKLTSEAGKRNERGVDPVITPAAADRVVELLVDVRRRHRRARRDRRRRGAAAPPPIAIGLRPARPGSPASTSPPTTTVANLEAVGCAGRGRPTTRSPVTPPTVAPRPHRPLRPGRGGRPDRRLRPGAVGAAARGRRPRADPRAAAAPPDRPHPGRRRLRRGDQLPVRRRRGLRPARAARRRPAAPHGPAGQPAVGRGAVVHHDAAARPAPAPPPATSAAVPRASRCSRPARWRSRSTAARRRSTASTGGPATTSSPSCSRRSPSSRCTWPSCWPASASGPAGGAPAATAGWSDAIGLVRRLGDELGVEVEVTSASRMPWHPGRCAQVRASAESSSATPASCTRRCARRSGCRRAPRPSRSTSTS